MKRLSITLILALATAATALSAQEVVPAAETEPAAVEQENTTPIRAVHIPVRQRLAEPDTLWGATVEVVEHGAAQKAVEEFEAATDSLRTIDGYRVRIFSDNSQSARAGAFAAQARFNENYSAASDIVYENPYYFVTCGNCATKEEALMLLAKIRIHFPKAFIVSSKIELKNL